MEATPTDYPALIAQAEAINRAHWLALCCLFYTLAATITGRVGRQRQTDCIAAYWDARITG